jgi:prepilin-type N-terminal cleavage/methylation domain-containing protein
MWPTLHHKKGFTIVELLVAAVILVILIGSITAVFLAANRSWTQSEARLQIYQNARNSLNRMSKEIASSFASSSVNFELTDSDYSGGSYDNDQLTFVAAYNFEPDSGEYDLTHLGYRLDTTDSDNPVLQRYKKDFSSSYDGSPLDSNCWKEMALYIISLNFRCHDGSDWKNSWSSSSLPEAVEITIQVQDKQERYDPKEFKSTVYISASQ